MTQTLLSVEVDRLVPDPTQPRKHFLPGEIERLAASILARGVLAPLRVQFDEERQSFRILTGESRWRASRRAGLTHVPCMVVEGGLSEAEILSDQIVENSVRSGLRPLDFCRALAKLKALKGCNSKALAAELGLNPVDVTRAEALLTLPPDMQAAIDEGRFSESAAYEVSRLPDEEAQRALFQEIVAGRMSRDQAAEAVRSRIGKRNVKPKASRVACCLGDMTVSFTSEAALSWENLRAALGRLGREVERLQKAGKDVTSLARMAQTS